MAKRTTRKFAIYNTLQAALRRAGFEKTGALTTLLLETFIENAGLLTANAVKKADLCGVDGFKAWREPLIKAGWLQYDHELAKALLKGSQHQPGKLLIPYLNKEKMKSHSLVTEKQLNDSLSSIHTRVDALGGFVRLLIEKVDPPWDEEKEERYMHSPGALVDKMRDNIRDNDELGVRLHVVPLSEKN